MAKFFAHARHDLRVFWFNWRTQLRAAAMLRGAFISQIVGMILNNVCIFGAWLFFFGHFGTVNGWSAIDFIGLGGVNAIVFGVVSLLVVGLTDLPRYVDSGAFDNFLTKPTSLLTNIASSKVDVTTIGDIFFGVAVVTWYMFQVDVSLVSLMLFLIALTAAAIIFFSFAMLLPFILSFYVFDSERISRYFGVLFLDSGFYPSGVITGALRTVFIFIIPGILYASMPVNILRGLDWHWAGGSLLVALGWLTVTLWLFKRAVRRYESANLVGAR